MAYFKPSSSRTIDSMESGLSSEDVPVQQPSSFTSKRLFAVGAGLLGLAGCAATVLHVSAPSRAGMEPAISARALLEHPDFIDTATENVQTLLGNHMQSKDHTLRPAIRHAMSKVTELLNEHDPEGARQLEAIKLNQQQKTDVLSVVKRMSDKHVQAVGKEVLEIAMKHQNDEDKAMDGIERDISSAFHPRLEELKTLKNSVMPASLRSKTSDVSAASEEQDTVRQRRLCKGDTSVCKPGSEITSKMAKDTNMKLEDAGGIIAALLEQARLALDESAVIGGAFGSPTHVPYYWRSAIAGLDYAAEVGDCLMRQNDKHITDADGKAHIVDSHNANPVKSSMCYMKYAGAGMDFLAGLNNVAGIQNSRLHDDFQTMFGGANPQAVNSPGAQQHAAQMNPFAMFAPHPQPTAHPMAQIAEGVGNMMGQHAANLANTAATNLANTAAAHAQNFATAAAQAHAAASATTAGQAAAAPAVEHAFAYSR